MAARRHGDHAGRSGLRHRCVAGATRHARCGDDRALLASFLYFDTGFTVWVMYGPLAPSIAKDYALNDAQKGFLVAVPVLAAAILRVTFGNMYQAIDGKRLALLGIVLSALPPAV